MVRMVTKNSKLRQRKSLFIIFIATDHYIFLYRLSIEPETFVWSFSFIVSENAQCTDKAVVWELFAQFIEQIAPLLLIKVQSAPEMYG